MGADDELNSKCCQYYVDIYLIRVPTVGWIPNRSGSALCLTGIYTRAYRGVSGSLHCADSLVNDFILASRPSGMLTLFPTLACDATQKASSSPAIDFSLLSMSFPGIIVELHPHSKATTIYINIFIDLVLSALFVFLLSDFIS